MLDRLRRVSGRLPRSQWSPFAVPDACSGQAFYPVRFLSLFAYICVHPRFVCLLLRVPSCAFAVHMLMTSSSRVVSATARVPQHREPFRVHL